MNCEKVDHLFESDKQSWATIDFDNFNQQDKEVAVFDLITYNLGKDFLEILNNNKILSINILF